MTVKLTRWGTMPETHKCKRCARERTMNNTRGSRDYCGSCVQIIAREQRAAVPHARCLVTLARIERWHTYDRLSRV